MPVSGVPPMTDEDIRQMILSGLPKGPNGPVLTYQLRYLAGMCETTAQLARESMEFPFGGPIDPDSIFELDGAESYRVHLARLASDMRAVLDGLELLGVLPVMTDEFHADRRAKVMEGLSSIERAN